MSDSLNREFLTFEVRETSEGRGHWLSQPWVEESQRSSLIKAEMLAIPQMREEGPTFPLGTGEFVERMREVLGTATTLALAVSQDSYQELSLHSKTWRLPTLLLTAGIVPVVLNILSNRIDEVLPGHKSGDTTELTLIVENHDKKTLKLHFKGDTTQLGPMLQSAIPKYLEAISDAPAAPHQVSPRKHTRSKKN